MLHPRFISRRGHVPNMFGELILAQSGIEFGKRDFRISSWVIWLHCSIGVEAINEDSNVQEQLRFCNLRSPSHCLQPLVLNPVQKPEHLKF